MMKKRYLVALGAVSAVLGACGSAIDSPPGGNPESGGSAGTGNNTAGKGNATAGSGNPGTGGSNGTSGSSSAGSSSNTAGNGGAGGTGGPVTCQQGIPETSQFPRLLNRQYDRVVYDLLGVTLVAPDNKKPSELLFSDFDGPMNDAAWRLYQEVAFKIAEQVVGGANRAKFIACDPATAGCLSDTVRNFGRKMFRRPVSDLDVARFDKLSQTMPQGTAEEVAVTTLAALLVSPSFLLRTEVGTEVEGGGIKLSQHELAARLSFMLWDSVPDDVLSTAADNGELATKEQILAQAQRMIMVREKTGPMVAAFHRKYLDMETATSHWWKIQQDPAKYPGYTPDAVPVFSAELDRFFEDVAFGGGSFKDLFLSNIGYVNNLTAAFYGLNAQDYGTELTRVELNPEQRPGFLTRLGFLSSFSHADSTSPILRGAFITVKMIGVDPGPPDPRATQVPAPEGMFETEREFVDALTSSQPSCQGCHIPFINPPGYVLERYDAVGKWQEVDARGGPIDGSAEVTFSADNVKMINSPLELMQEIGNGPLARHIYAEQWVSFATGRTANNNDACLADQLDAKLSEDGYTVLKLLADLTQADSFRLRVKGN
jgi:hypothetical protein